MENNTINSKVTKFIYVNNDVCRLCYEMIKSKSGINGIRINYECYDKNDYCNSDIPKAKKVIYRKIYLKNKNETEILKIINFLSTETVFPDDAQDIISEIPL